MSFPIPAVSRAQRCWPFRLARPSKLWLRRFSTLAGLGLLAAGARAEQIVELPPYAVETTALREPWQYAKLPGVEILSRCSEPTTLLLLDHHFRLRETLTALLPEEFQVQLDVPTTYVLFNDTAQQGVARELVGELRKREGDADSWIIRGMSNYRFGNKDAVALFFILDPMTFGQGRMTLTPGYLRFLLENRTPSLPLWFVEGMLEVYRTAILESVPAGRSVSMSAVETPPLPEGVIAIRPALWISEAMTQAIRKSRQKTCELLPAATLFSTLPSNHTDTIRTALWRSQAALFIRWALDGRSLPPRREALWAFVRRACRQPVTEAMFQECFGLDYAGLEQQLRAYLPEAVKGTFYLSTTRVFEAPVAQLREATEAEISRLKGGLDRLEIAYVKEFFPELAPQYITQARHTLRRAYDRGDRDPRLLAELGLCECDAGDDAAARPFLEAAVLGKVVRPCAHYELARIYYQELLAKSPDGRLTVAEAGRVLAPLAVALRQAPPLPEVYELIAEVWLRAQGRLSPAQFAVLEEGVRNFAWRARLIYSAALLNSLQGRMPEARALIEKGLGVVESAEGNAPFLKLQSALEANADGTAK